MTKTRTKSKIEPGDRVVFATAPINQTVPMRGTVLKILRVQARTGGIANVLVQWDNGYIGKAQDFTLTVVSDE